MTIDRVAMKELLEKGSDQDLLREMLAFVADEAIQIHGGYGFVKDYPVERALRMPL